MGNSWPVSLATRDTKDLTCKKGAPSGTRTPNPVDESHGLRGDAR